MFVSLGRNNKVRAHNPAIMVLFEQTVLLSVETKFVCIGKRNFWMFGSGFAGNVREGCYYRQSKLRSPPGVCISVRIKRQ